MVLVLGFNPMPSNDLWIIGDGKQGISVAAVHGQLEKSCSTYSYLSKNCKK
jgi:hypothetical protein